MKVSWIDGMVIAVYLLLLIIIGLWQKKKAAADKQAYLLGGNNMPWYMLGLSNASGMFDISGTMWMVALTFIYGMKSVWIPWLWPCFNQIFMMVYLSAWLRRSGVTTGAEWITFRFGKDRGAKLSHTIVIIFALINGLGFLAYGFVGLGKFVEMFLPWSIIGQYVPFEVAPEYVPHFYGIIFTLFSVFYSIVGGMSSIVIADVLQYTIMTVAGIAVAGIAVVNLQTSGIIDLPEGWMSPFFGQTLDLHWSLDAINAKIQSDGYELFMYFFMMMLCKGVLVSMAGPAPNYDMQKVLSTRSSREASLMSFFVNIVLLPTRYIMIIGFALLGLMMAKSSGLEIFSGAKGLIDFELILPAAMNKYIPVGLMGVLLAGLLSAFIGTFAGTLNATQAYMVNDIYLKYINPKASNQTITKVNYLSGIVIVAVSIILGIFAEDINSVLQWLVSGLFGSYVAANVLKWHWWRFNGSGYFWGMVSGLIPALIFPKLIGGLDLYYFPYLLVISFVGSIVGTFLAPATEKTYLMEFFRKVRPWGAWGPIRRAVENNHPDFVYDATPWRDWFNVAIGIVWQATLMICPMYLVLAEWTGFWISFAVMAVTSIILKFTWYNNLEKEEIVKK